MPAGAGVCRHLLSDEDARVDVEYLRQLPSLLGADLPLAVQGLVHVTPLAENGEEVRGGLAGMFQEKPESFSGAILAGGLRVEAKLRRERFAQVFVDLYRGRQCITNILQGLLRGMAFRYHLWEDRTGNCKTTLRLGREHQRHLDKVRHTPIVPKRPRNAATPIERCSGDVTTMSRRTCSPQGAASTLSQGPRNAPWPSGARPSRAVFNVMNAEPPPCHFLLVSLLALTEPHHGATVRRRCASRAATVRERVPAQRSVGLPAHPLPDGRGSVAALGISEIRFSRETDQL